MAYYKKYIEVFFNRNIDKSTELGRSQERNRRIVLTSITSVFSRILSMAIPLITIKLTFPYLGKETYGLWMTATSFFALFTFADLGMGSGLQTNLSKLSGTDDVKTIKKLISSTFFLLIAVSVLLFIVFFIINPFISWSSIVNAKSQNAILLSGGVVFAIVFSRIVNIPLALVNRTQLALQEGFQSNLWQSMGSILSLIIIYVVVSLNLGSLWLIWATSLISAFVALINMISFFWVKRPDLKPSFKLFDREVTKSLFKTGTGFLILSILTTLGLSMDNFIVARTCSLEEVAVFSVVARTTQLISVACTMISLPLWSANGEALARGDIKWVRNNTNRMVKISLGITIFTSIFFAIFAKSIFHIWLGSNMNISYILLFGMLAMQILFSFVSPYFMVLNGAGIVMKQVAIFLIFTPVVFIMKFILATYFGMVVIPWIGVICYLIIVIPSILFVVKKTLI